jgi:hypothetical protein
VANGLWHEVVQCVFDMLQKDHPFRGPHQVLVAG